MRDLCHAPGTITIVGFDMISSLMKYCMLKRDGDEKLREIRPIEGVRGGS